MVSKRELNILNVSQRGYISTNEAREFLKTLDFQATDADHLKWHHKKHTGLTFDLRPNGEHFENSALNELMKQLLQKEPDKYLPHEDRVEEPSPTVMPKQEGAISVLPIKVVTIPRNHAEKSDAKKLGITELKLGLKKWLDDNFIKPHTYNGTKRLYNRDDLAVIDLSLLLATGNQTIDYFSPNKLKEIKEVLSAAIQEQKGEEKAEEFKQLFQGLVDVMDRERETRRR